MNLQEPKVEFVPIEQNVFTEAGSSMCTDWANEDPTGGGQRCVGSQPEAKPCTDFQNSIPW